jgi:hypothetical protein
MGNDHYESNRRTDTQADRRTDRQIDRLADRRTDRLKCEMDGWTNRKTDRRMDVRETEEQRDWWTDRQIEKKTNEQRVYEMDRETGGQRDVVRWR